MALTSNKQILNMAITDNNGMINGKSQRGGMGNLLSGNTKASEKSEKRQPVNNSDLSWISEQSNGGDNSFANQRNNPLLSKTTQQVNGKVITSKSTTANTNQ